MTSVKTHDQQRFEYAGREVMRRLIEAGHVDTVIARPRHQWQPRTGTVETGPEPGGEAVTTALISLAGRASVEASGCVMVIDEPSGTDQEVRDALSDAIPDPAEFATTVDALRVRAETVVNNCWTIIESIAEVFGQQPETEFDDEDYLFTAGLDWLETAHISSIAAKAVCIEVLPGGMVRWVLLHSNASPAVHSAIGSIRASLGGSDLMDRVLATRDTRLQSPELQGHFQDLDGLTKKAARRREFDITTLAQLAVQWEAYERRVDQAVGPVAPALYPELTALLEQRGLRLWVGESASRRMTGISVPDRLGQVWLLRHFLMMQFPPDEAVTRLLEGRGMADEFVTEHWAAIVLARYVLKYEGGFYGERLHSLIHEVTQPSDKRAA